VPTNCQPPARNFSRLDHGATRPHRQLATPHHIKAQHQQGSAARSKAQHLTPPHQGGKGPRVDLERRPGQEQGERVTSDSHRSTTQHQGEEGGLTQHNGTESTIRGRERGPQPGESLGPQQGAKDWAPSPTTTTRAPTHPLPHRGSSDTERARAWCGKRMVTIPWPGAGGGGVRVSATPRGDAVGGRGSEGGAPPRITRANLRTSDKARIIREVGAEG
jgi:hypothetical protein